jgi:hypothetical protein
MEIVTPAELRRLARAYVKRFGLIAGLNADGFGMDLDHALFELAGLSKVRISKTDDEACRFQVVAAYEGDAGQLIQRILAALEDEVVYSNGGIATWTVDDGHVTVQFLTWAEVIGAATVCLRVSALDRPGG